MSGDARRDRRGRGEMVGTGGKEQELYFVWPKERWRWRWWEEEERTESQRRPSTSFPFSSIDLPLWLAVYLTASVRDFVVLSSFIWCPLVWSLTRYGSLSFRVEVSNNGFFSAAWWSILDWRKRSEFEAKKILFLYLITLFTLQFYFI